MVVAGGCALTANASDNQAAPSNYDHEVARQAKSTHHATPAKTERGDALRSTQSPGKLAGLAKSNAGTASALNNGRPRYPGDLEYHGGAVLEATESHAIYVNTSSACPAPSCWGSPETFLRDLGNSDFIHIVDQYIGLNSDSRYTVGSNAKVTYPVTAGVPMTDNDVLAIVHFVASQTGQTGYGHMYQVFLPPGQDECFDSSFSQCYSPDNFAVYAFCAYHGSVDFSDIGHVVYSVEPYQNVPGCFVRSDTPNGPKTDGTNSTLSHELIEAITDPDGDGWWNHLDNGVYGEEIGDECSFLAFSSTGSFLGFDPSNVRLDRHNYAIQPEYSNNGHACLTKPD
jgi:hypothetical protein